MIFSFHRTRNFFWLLAAAVIFFSCTKEDGVTPNWPKKTELPASGRQYAVSFTINNKAYVGTGYNSSYLKDFWEYDPAANAWQQKADFGGTARERAVGFSVGAKGYIGTGYDGSPVNDFWEYNPSTNSWMQKNSLPGLPRNNAIAFVVGSKAYIGTGWDGNGSGTYLWDFWEFTPDSNTWIQKADIPVNKRYLAVAFSIGSKGYAGLGSYNGGTLSDFYEYNSTTNSWLQKANFPNPVADVASFVLGGNAYVYTGASKDNFFEYEPSLNTWIPKASFTGNSRSGATGFSLNGQGYIGIGYTREYKKDFFEYFP